MADKLKVTLVKSPIGCVPKHKRTVEALGLKKVNKSVELPNNAATLGMVKQGRRDLIIFEGGAGREFINIKASRRF